MIFASYLRVYSAPRHFGDARTARSPLKRDVVRADGHFMWAESDIDDAFEVEWNGERLVCPRNGRLRMLEGILAFSSSNPGALLLPAAKVQQAAAELDAMKSGRPRARSHILTSPWHVPLRWFAAFTADERELYDVGTDASLRYRTDLAAAVERIARAVRVIEDAGFDESIVSQVEDLERWLDGFPAGSMLELDYATVAQLFTAVELAFDESVAQIGDSIDALEQLDYETAGERYADVATRWAQAQSLTYVN